jgi:UDP-GlcNAc:undecaprenyl-phosphate/decaprenyl-phosphate GlcNAc-1-phosphate transferase
MHNLSEFPFTVKYIIILLVTAIIALILTPIMVVVSRKIGAVDNPNARRINVKPMPSAGGVAIFVAFSIITLLVLPRLLVCQIIQVLKSPISAMSGPLF